jgi:uncharacterized protein YbaR (Trm112 family)
MIVFGIVVPFQADKSTAAGVWTAVGGGVLTVLGGVLISWTAQGMLATSHAQADVAAKLGSVARGLGTAASSIMYTVQQAFSDQIDSETALYLVQRDAMAVRGEVHEIGVISGERFDRTELLGTLRETDALLRDLGDRLGAAGEVDIVREKLALVRSGVEQVSVADDSVSELTVECPHCSSPAVVQLGPVHHTQMLICWKCKNRFNAHFRISDGTTFTRAMNTHPSVREVIDCPVCKTKVSFSLNPSDDGKKLVCPSCASWLMFERQGSSVELIGEYSIEEGEIVGWSGDRPRMTCRSCGNSFLTMFSDAEYFIALCHTDKSMMRVSRSE